MVKQLDKFPAHGRTQFDWDTLLDGGIYELQKDVDFTSQPHSMRSLALGQARRRGGKVKSHINKDKTSITIQFVQVNEAAEEVQD